MNEIIPKSNTSKIRICKKVLQLESIITWQHYYQVQHIFQTHIENNKSPAEIAKFYGLEYTDFGMILKKCFGIKLKSLKESVNNYMKKIGRARTDEKIAYFKQCVFAFDPYIYTNIPGYEHLLISGIYHPQQNPNGMCRDHMISKEYGYRNNIPPHVIAHPANCQFISNIDNLKKGTGCCITLETLLHRIDRWDTNLPAPTIMQSRQLPKTTLHKSKISETNKQKRTYNNGFVNIRLNIGDIIPDNFVPGMLKCRKRGS